MMSLEETFGITLDEEGALFSLLDSWAHFAEAPPLWTLTLATDTTATGAEKITTVQEAADLIQSQMK